MSKICRGQIITAEYLGPFRCLAFEQYWESCDKCMHQLSAGRVWCLTEGLERQHSWLGATWSQQTKPAALHSLPVQTGSFSHACVNDTSAGMCILMLKQYWMTVINLGVNLQQNRLALEIESLFDSFFSILLPLWASFYLHSHVQSGAGSKKNYFFPIHDTLLSSVQGFLNCLICFSDNSS